MKLLQFAETVGKLFWIQYQSLKTDGGWEVIPVGDITLGYVTPELSFTRVNENWPTLPADQEGVAAILRSNGYELDLKGRSPFNGRNFYVVRKTNPLTQEFIAPLIILGALRGRQKKAVGLNGKLFFHDKFILDMEENYIGQIAAGVEIKEADSQVEAAKIEWLRRKKEHFAQKFFAASKDFGLTAVMNIGGEEEFDYEDIPDHFFELGRRCLAFTQDHRQNLTHTYQVVLINTVRIAEKHAVNIKIPNEMKGFVIGKGGANIKSSAEKLGKRLYII